MAAVGGGRPQLYKLKSDSSVSRAGYGGYGHSTPIVERSRRSSPISRIVVRSPSQDPEIPQDIGQVNQPRPPVAPQDTLDTSSRGRHRMLRTQSQKEHNKTPLYPEPITTKQVRTFDKEPQRRSRSGEKEEDQLAIALSESLRLTEEQRVKDEAEEADFLHALEESLLQHREARLKRKARKEKKDKGSTDSRHGLDKEQPQSSKTTSRTQTKMPQVEEASRIRSRHKNRAADVDQPRQEDAAHYILADTTTNGAKPTRPNHKRGPSLNNLKSLLVGLARKSHERGERSKDITKDSAEPRESKPSRHRSKLSAEERHQRKNYKIDRDVLERKDSKDDIEVEMVENVLPHIESTNTKDINTRVNDLKRTTKLEKFKAVNTKNLLVAAKLASKPKISPRVVECNTCLADDIPEKNSAELQCGHRFCNDCLVRLFTLSLTDPAHMPPRCCQPNEHIPLQHVNKLLSTKTKQQWNKKYQEFTTANRIYCPQTDCGEWIRPKDFSTDEGRKVGKCSRCKTMICGICGLKDHGTTECPKDEELNRVRELGQELGWQRCYNCRAMVELERGCNHMTCRCTAEFCMICGLKWKTCNCPWFNFEPQEDDEPAPQFDAQGHVIWPDQDLAWGLEDGHRRRDNAEQEAEDERIARLLAMESDTDSDSDTDEEEDNGLWSIFRLLLGTNSRENDSQALDRLRRAYASSLHDDALVFGHSDSEEEEEERRDGRIINMLDVEQRHARESERNDGLYRYHGDGGLESSLGREQFRRHQAGRTGYGEETWRRMW